MFFEKIIPHSFFFSTFYYTFIGVSDLCFASGFPMSLSEGFATRKKTPMSLSENFATRKKRR